MQAYAKNSSTKWNVSYIWQLAINKIYCSLLEEKNFKHKIITKTQKEKKLFSDLQIVRHTQSIFVTVYKV